MHPASVLALCLLSVTTSSAADTTTDSGLPVTYLSNGSGTCENNVDCKDLQFCNKNTSTCLECMECCSSKVRDCPKIPCHCHWLLTDEQLKIVAQAVLGVAVFVTCVALLSLLWKICARRLRQRRAAAAGLHLLDDSTSLSSQQVFVVERLRDRPPRYEEAARDFAIEKPPPYSEVVVAEVERPPQTVLVGDVPITLVVGGLTAHNFMAPPPYSPTPTRSAASSSLAPPPVAATPPVQRLRRCVRKVVMISRLRRSSIAAPEVDCSSRPPKGASPQQCETVHASQGLPGMAGLRATATTSEPGAVTTGCPQSEAATTRPVNRGAAGEEFSPVPGSPTSTVA